jgi:Fe-Mn family superoxide dismutase
MSNERAEDVALTRREVMETVAWAGAGVVLAASLRGQPAMAEENPSAAPHAYRGAHEIQPLPFDPTKLKGLSERLLVLAPRQQLRGAVKRLNLIEQQLGSPPKDAATYQVGSLKREELIAANSKRLHELYFANLGGNGKTDGMAAALLGNACGSLEAWEHDLRQTALSLGGGSGWVVVAYDRGARSLHNRWAWDHAHQVAGGEPVLVLDMYEHSYHMDYGAAVKPYLDAFLANVACDEVNRRFEAAQSGARATS